MSGLGNGLNWMPGKVSQMFPAMAKAAEIARPRTYVCLNPECGHYLSPALASPPFLCHNCLYPWQLGDLTLLVNEAQIIGCSDDLAGPDFPSLRILVAIQEDNLIAISFS